MVDIIGDKNKSILLVVLDMRVDCVEWLKDVFDFFGFEIVYLVGFLFGGFYIVNFLF